MAYQSKFSGEIIDNILTDADTVGALTELMLKIYPVGSIYSSTEPVSPANLFGGTWEKIEGKFLLAADGTYAAGSTGGATTHTHTQSAHSHTTSAVALTVDQMPAHTHSFNRQQWYSADLERSSSTGAIYSWKTSTGGSTSKAYGRQDGKDVDETGGGASHSHGDTGTAAPPLSETSSLPPYIAVYFWKRVA